jgi:hypothetical protein
VKYHHPAPHTPGKALSVGTFCEDGAMRRWRGRAEAAASNDGVRPTAVSDGQGSFLMQSREERSVVLG